jgi:hypothetical protein
MAYQTGSASSSTDLIQKLITFLVANGWTQDRSASEGSGWTVTAHLGGQYVNLRACENETSPWQSGLGINHYGVHMYAGTGYNGSNPWNAQTGGPTGASTNPIGVGIQLTAGPFSNYYFFCDSGGDNVTVVVEKTPGLFLHLGWGATFQKAGSWTGGAYFYGSDSGFYTSDTGLGANIPGFTSTTDCPGVSRDGIGGGVCFVRADVDSFTGKWIGICSSSIGADQGYTGKGGDTSVRGFNITGTQFFPVYSYDTGISYEFQNEQTSALDGRANLLPVLLWALRDSTATGFSLLGSLPNVFFTNAVGNGFSNADEYTIGPDTYKLFPNFAVLKQ